MTIILWFAFLLIAQLPHEVRIEFGTIEGSVARAEQSGKDKPVELRAQAGKRGNLLFEKVLPDWIAAGWRERSRNVSLALVRQAGIHGRVLQPDGQPASGISVEIVKSSSFGRNPRILQPSGQPVVTSLNGEYRFNVAPGEYYVRTVAVPGGPQARTYSPNASDPGEARAILVEQGSDVSADIQLSTAPVFTITGRIVDLLPDRENHYPWGVSLSSTSATVREYKLQSAFPGMPICCDVETVPDLNVSVTLSNDRFEIRGVRPGTYQLNATIVVAQSKPESGPVLLKPGEKPPYSVMYRGLKTVEVTNSDVDDIRIEVNHGADLIGRIVSTGKRIETKDTDISISGHFISVDKAGRFTYPNLLDGTYTLDLLGLPIDAYVVEIRQGGKKLSGLNVIVNKAHPEPLEIIMNPSPGQIDGQVTGSNHSVIVLVPVDDPARYIPFPVRRVGDDGKFTFRGLGPGRYRIFAFNSYPFDAFVEGSSFERVRPYEAQGTPLVVKAGARTTVTLTAIDYVPM